MRKCSSLRRIFCRSLQTSCFFSASIFKYVVRAHCGHYGAPSPPCAVPARLLGTHGSRPSNNDSRGRRWIRGISAPAQPTDASAALLAAGREDKQAEIKKSKAVFFVDPAPRDAPSLADIFRACSVRAGIWPSARCVFI